MLIMGKRANVQGMSVGSTQMFEAMNRAIAAGGMKPVIDKVFSLRRHAGCVQAPAIGAAFRQNRHQARLIGAAACRAISAMQSRTPLLYGAHVPR